MLRYIFEIIGTIAFSVSGALVGIRKKMDVLGVTTLGVITAVGGGIIRDIIIGQTPPNAFKSPIYMIVAILVALLTFLPFISAKINLDHFFWIFADSFGLAAFTMIGVSYGASYNSIFIEIFLGVITGVGGGVIRDICAAEIPVIFVKHFYACSCIIGALLSACLLGWNSDIALVTGFFTIIILRILAAKFRWDLPKAK